MAFKKTAPNWNLVVSFNLLLALGAFVEISGGYWDVTRHIMSRPETFFTLQHIMLYSGVGMVAVSGFFGIILRRRYSGDELALVSLRGLRIAILGAALQLIAGPFDFWWHSTYGFDPVLLSPPHAMLIVGMAVNGLGSLIGMVGLWRLSSSGEVSSSLLSKKVVAPFLVFAAAALWLGLNGIVFLGTDLNGLRYQYALFTHSPLVIPELVRIEVALVAELALGLPGLVILVSVSRILNRFGWATSIAGVFIATNLITSVMERGLFFYVPILASMIVPAILLDYLISRGGNHNPKGLYLIGSMLFTPFTYVLNFPLTDGYFGQDVLIVSLYLLVPYLAIGLAASRTWRSFAKNLDPFERYPVQVPL